MASQYLYFWIDDRGRILELRVTRRGNAGDARSSGRYGRSMTRDLSASYLRLEDLPPTYADPVRQHVRRTGEQQGVVEISAGEPGSVSDDGPVSGSEDDDSGQGVESVRDEGGFR